MKGNSNSAGSDQDFIEWIEEERKRQLLEEKNEFIRKKFLSSKAWEIIAQIRYWAEKHWNKGIKENSKIRFDVTTKLTSEEKQICIKPILDLNDEHKFVKIIIDKQCNYQRLVSHLDSWLLSFHDNNIPTEKFDFEINDDSVVVKADISEYHDKCMAVYKQVRDQERAEKESVSPEVAA